MQTWIFQGNPDDFDIDGYLGTRPAQPRWLVTRHADEIAVEDRVYLWRNQGTSRAVAGVVAEGIVTAPAALREEDPAALPFWRRLGERSNTPQVRAVMRLVKVAAPREVLRRDWCMEDPILQELPNLRMQAGTNYLVTPDQALRLNALWSKTGHDWTRNEAIAGLWAYAETYGQPVSRLPGSPVSRIALLIGRAVSGVYAKVMNFRFLDPGASGGGMSAGSETDRAVWREFYDPSASTLRTDALLEEFSRLWGAEQPNSINQPEANATAAIVADEAERLETLTLEQLLARYAAQSTQGARRPTTRVLSSRAYERNPLVIAIARKRASHRCELQDCTHASFETAEGVSYTEVHHIVPLADGGEDSVENVACLCPSHHREVHLGAQAAKLTAQLKVIRGSNCAETR